MQTPPYADLIFVSGDHQTGLATLSSILAALLLRQKTGRGSLCEAALNRTSAWNMSEVSNGMAGE